MESNKVSLHEVRLFYVFAQNPTRWITSKEAATEAGVAWRTARAHAAKLVKLGVLDVAEVFPARRYRLAAKADKRNAGYIGRLRATAEVFKEEFSALGFK